MWVLIWKWIKHLHTVTLNIQGKNIFLGIHLKYQINLTSVTKPFGETIVRNINLSVLSHSKMLY